ncbi:hypothetical protein HPP92_015578 [Vanilla planifolia]|uniref:Pentatricopeptide repeat-containing protein n=1 Tax=Vanilla planifolia TaxID=51239 RepID=A0A835QLF2_VANPL|nr:hypothetical protein HPP92_015578 [Vanilla planifolia]
MLVEGVKPNAFTISALLSGYNSRDSPSLLFLLHCHSIKLGLSSDGFVGGALVNHYERLTGLEDAVRAFEDISHVDEVSWNIMIDACARSGSKEETVCVFSRMRWNGGGFDSFALTSVLKTCLEKMDLSLGMQLHGSALKVGLDSDTAVGNALITMYSRCENRVDSVFLVFSTIHEPNIITWTALISALLHHKMAKEAIDFYRKMLRSGILENEFCFSSVLPAFSEFSSLEHGRMVHSRILKSTFQLDVGVGNTVMDMYFKCGIIEDAQLVFQTMTKIDVVSWTTIISGFGQHGKGREALKLFKMMEERGFIPDGVTFLGALSACSHGGLVDEGIKLFKSMVDVYCIQPRKEHFACVVDLFGRAGRLNEADSFIEEMGLKSDALVWETLLAGCELHGEVELGKKSAERVIELKPGEDLPYVSLSNIYAEKKMWEEKVEVRSRLDACGSKKDAAQSWV